jgi:AFG3 family protein
MENPENKPKLTGGKMNSFWIYGILILFIIGLNFLTFQGDTSKSINFDQFEEMATRGDVSKVEIVNQKFAYVFIKKDRLKAPNHEEPKAKVSPLIAAKDQFQYSFETGPIESFGSQIKELKARLPKEANFPLEYSERTNWLGPILSWIIPFLLLFLVWMFILRRAGGGGGPGAQIFNIGKSKATLFDQNSKVNVTFQDVAGLDEAKDEVIEIVDFLKNPKKYTALGGKIPKGVLLVGPPGTGKTLLAKAVAGEADVPFFSISGSDFVEMFVGVGASRVRDLFKQAREKAPCIVFIDEIDAIGRARGKGQFTGGNDERENTLNQLLVEMDGFPTDKAVIMMAATNRVDILDGALLRAGRFDRQIGLDRPDLVGRAQIFRVHLKNIKTNEDVDAEQLGEMTPGFVGADIANICNEAALIAARRNKTSVDMDDFNYALDKVIGGLEKKNKIIAPHEKEIIAYHEAGHAVCGWFLEHAMPLVKVTIVPRGVGTLGYAQYLPKDEYITRTEALLDRMCMTMGGRAAEQVIFGKISTGAQSDLDQVTRMGYSMVSMFGMNELVGNVSFAGMVQDQMLDKPYSDETATMIDKEVRKMIDEQYSRAKGLLIEHKDALEILAKTLLEKEVLHKNDLVKLIGPRPFTDKKELLHLTENGVLPSSVEP